MIRNLGDVPTLEAYLVPFSAWLVRRGFQEVERRDDPQHFGDALRVYANDDMRIRFSRDRWVFYVEVASLAKPSDWLPPLVALAFIGAGPSGAYDRDLGQRDPAESIKLLENGYERLAEFLGIQGFVGRRSALQDFVKIEAMRKIDRLRDGDS